LVFFGRSGFCQDHEPSRAQGQGLTMARLETDSTKASVLQPLTKLGECRETNAEKRTGHLPIAYNSALGLQKASLGVEGRPVGLQVATVGPGGSHVGKGSRGEAPDKGVTVDGLQQQPPAWAQRSVELTRASLYIGHCRYVRLASWRSGG
jgi:hypothetical protein